MINAPLQPLCFQVPLFFGCWRRITSWLPLMKHLLPNIHPSIHQSVSFLSCFVSYPVAISLWEQDFFLSAFSYPFLIWLQLLGSGPVDHVTLFPVWQKGGWRGWVRRVSSFLFPLLAISYPRVPTSIILRRLDWFPHLQWTPGPGGERNKFCRRYLSFLHTRLLLCFSCGKPRGRRWLLHWWMHREKYFHAPSIWCSIFMFSDELTAQRKLLVISVQHCRQTVLCLIKVIETPEQISLLTKNKLVNMLIMVSQLKGSQ